MKARVISFNCVLRDSLGKIISSSFNHDVLTQSQNAASGGEAEASIRPKTSQFDFHEPLQGLVDGLQGLKEGERRKIFVTAERAYGFYDPELVMRVPRKKFPKGEALEVGFQVMTQSDDGESRVFRVIESDATSVTLDGNHPLAGQDLCFDIEAVAARDATDEELASARPIPNERRPAVLH
jgi:FKBP-type peptidyl-prolyl cis-trans isomerase SlyD